MRESITGTILNINDNEASRYIVSKVLKGAGYQVLEAGTAREGIDLAVEKQPDLIILDIQLPDFDGFEAADLLKKQDSTSRIPILHLTAHAISTESRIKSLEKGAEAYLTFPVEAPYLLATLRALLRLQRLEKEKDALLARELLERKKLEQTLHELESERAVKEQFVATLSHDLRSPLTAIKMTAQLLMRRAHDPETFLAQCGRIIASANRADKMIRDLLDASLLRVGQKLPVERVNCDLVLVVREIIDDLISTHGTQIVGKIQDSAMEVSVDCSSIRRAIDNLVQNAIKYGSTSQPITISLYREKDNVVLNVHNFGSTIPKDLQRSLFETFARSPDAKKSNTPGWGLGLALVRGVAEAHDGTVQVTSDEKTGTTFILKLPVFISTDSTGLMRTSSDKSNSKKEELA